MFDGEPDLKMGVQNLKLLLSTGGRERKLSDNHRSSRLLNTLFPEKVDPNINCYNLTKSCPFCLKFKL